MYVVLIHNEGYFLILKSICVTIFTRSTCSSLRGARRLRSHLRRRGAGWDPISGEEGWDLISDGDSEVGIWVLSLRLSLKMVGQRRILVLSFVLLEIVVALHTPRELLICIMPFFKKPSYFHSVNISTIPRFIIGKKGIFGIIRCISVYCICMRRKRYNITTFPLNTVSERDGGKDRMRVGVKASI